MENEDILNQLESKLKEEKIDYVIFDLSFYPFLSEKLQITFNKVNTKILIPDTIEKLLDFAKKDSQYYYTLTKLFTRWTGKAIDLKLIENIIKNKKFGKFEVKMITMDDVDKKTYDFCYEKIKSQNLITKFSPEFNLLGDVIGKILGAAKKFKAFILMSNRRLQREIRRFIPIFDAVNTFVDEKTRFFGSLIPGIRRTRGVRWLLAMTIGTLYSPVGFALGILDP